MKEINLDNGYTLQIYPSGKWDILRSDRSLVNTNNLPAYVEALVNKIIEMEGKR